MKAYYHDPLLGIFGSSIILHIINYSTNMVHIILGIDFGFWALQLLFFKLLFCNIINLIIYIERSMGTFIIIH
jgi:hypothetical protein